MKTMKDFSAFKLNKNQMSAMKGGIKCEVSFDGRILTFEADVTENQAMQYLNNVYGWMDGVEILGCK